MSTVADDFFIMDRKKLNPFLTLIEDKLGRYLIEHFRKHTAFSGIVESGDFGKLMKLEPEITKVMQSHTYTENDHFDLWCGVSIWLWNDYAVVKPYGFNGDFCYRLKQNLPRYIKEFEYWNNTDKPDNVPILEWNRRERFFEHTIENLPRLDFTPYDFITRNNFKTISKLRNKYKEVILNQINPKRRSK